MKKFTAFAVVSTMVFTMASMNSLAANVGDAGKDKAFDKKAKQISVLEKIDKASKGKEKVLWNNKKGIPSFVTGKLSNKKLKSSSDALAVLEENKDLFDIASASEEFALAKQSTDELGTSMYKFQQTYKGIPVFANEIIVHTDKAGTASSINGYFDPEVKNSHVKTNPKLSAGEALEAAKVATGTQNAGSFDIAASDVVIYGMEGQYSLTYKVTLSTLDNETPVYADVFVDAIDGSIVNVINKESDAAATGSGTGVLGDTKTLHTDSYSGGYYLRDLTKPMYSSTGGKIETYTANNGTSLPGTLLTDSDNNWTDRAAVDAHYYAGVVYDYYYNTHGQNSYDGNGSTMKSTVHYDRSYNNAFWNGTQMVYGDGDGSTFTYFSGALDVVGHEITHAVTERSANLVYQGQSGALNESWSDAMGNLIETKSDPNWLVGEDIYTPGTPGDSLRSMSNPGIYGDPGHMDDYVYTSSDNGGVHTNSGIPNHAFYLFVTSSGVTEAQAGKVWYRALTQYMTSNSQFVDARVATIQAATDLYGASSTVTTAVTNAWTNVGVGGSGGGGGTTGDQYEPNNSQSAAYGPLTSGTTYNATISSSTDVDWFKFTISNTGNISLSLTNLPGDYDLYLYNSAGTELTKSWNGGTTSESISYNATATGTYYAKVVGYNGVNSSSAYALKATYPTSGGGGGTGQWYYENVSWDTPHPYSNNYDNDRANEYTKAGATQVAVHFSRFETESGYDFVDIYDKNLTKTASYSGTKAAFWAIVDGDDIIPNLVSDYSVTAYGYHIDQVAYFSTSPLLGGSTTTTVEPIVGE
ncbi:MAG TPA: M4 family metallopeptidase [Bacilli bacterium]|nr:M4 family metallopeptidase [Bacilli bacterium]